MGKLMERLLANRGLTKEDLEAFEDASHPVLQGTGDLLGRLHEIHDGKKKLVVLPDFDMDGIMSGIVGLAGFSQLGFDVELFVPDPSEGYGFGPAQVDRLLAEHPGTDAIITCDCGITCVAGTRHAIGRGVEVLVTDHHMENPENSVRGMASVVVDPCAEGETYDHPAICGAHVLWQCLDAYAREFSSPEDVDKIRMLRVFAGIGTVSDVMPVLYENRALIRDAISICKDVWTCDKRFIDALDGSSDAYRQAFRGLYSAVQLLAANGKISDPSDIDEEFFGFHLAPTFNSAKRLDGDMSEAFGVFTDAPPAPHMRYMYDLNQKRKQLVKDAVAQMREQDNELAPYCYVVDALPGILGLLAMNMMGETGTPCVVVARKPGGNLSGSGRSPSWYPFLSNAGGAGYRVAGHEGAFGIGVSGYPELERLHDFLREDVPAVMAEIPPEDMAPDADIVIDTSGGGDIGIEPFELVKFVEELEGYRPFGRGFEKPRVKVRFDASEANWRIIGHDGDHLKLHFDEGFDILCWGQASKASLAESGGVVEVVGALSVNEFRGAVTPQLVGDIVSEPSWVPGADG